jgi:hypothetical protein
MQNEQEIKNVSRRYMLLLDYVSHVHRHDYRDIAENTPTINHCIHKATLLRLLADVSDEDILMAAMAQDVLFKASETPEKLRQNSNDYVVKLVQEVTFDKKFSVAENIKMDLYKPPLMSQPAKLIKLISLYDNVYDMQTYKQDHLTIDFIKGFMAYSCLLLLALKGTHKKIEDEVMKLLLSKFTHCGRLHDCLSTTDPDRLQVLFNDFHRTLLHMETSRTSNKN